MRFRNFGYSSVVGLMLLVTPRLSSPVLAQTRVATGPLVRYAPEPGGRQLLFSNNPEQVYSGYTDTFSTPNTTTYDLADVNLGNQSLLQITVDPGQYRNYFEHVNKYTLPLYYAVQVYNPGSANLTVTLVGKGFTSNATAGGSSSGASAIADLFNYERTTGSITYTVRPGRSVWVLRSDTDYSSQTNLVNGTAAGVVDFDISGGQAIVSNVAYRNQRSLGAWEYQGYNVRRYSTGTSPAPESRVYKGLYQYPGQTSATGAQVLAEMSFAIDDSTPVSELPVHYNTYAKNGSGDYVDSGNLAPVTSPSTTDTTCWYTNDVPSRDKTSSTVPKAYQVGNDMFDISLPTTSGSLLVSALRDGSWPNTAAVQPNLGNYGVLYHERITVTNNSASSTARTLTLSMNNYSASASYAYIDYTKTDGTWTWDWSRTTITGGNPTPAYNRTVTYASFSVPGDGVAHTYDVYWMLGAPSGGQIRHAVKVTNAVP